MFIAGRAPATQHSFTTSPNLRCVRQRTTRAVRAPAIAKSASAEDDKVDDPEYLYGTNKGAAAKKPKNAMEQFLYDFYFKAPKKSEFEKKLQVMADDKFKGLRNWKKIHTELTARKIKSLSPAEAAKLAAGNASGGLFGLGGGGGAVLLDIREEEKFELGHAKGAVNVPLYVVMKQAADDFDKIRSVYFALFGMKVPVRNESFAEQVEKAVGGKNKKIIVMCQTGGTLETTEQRKARNPRLPAPIYGEYGAASRSLMAVHELVTNGFTNVSHLDGGLSQWRADGFEMDD